MNKTCYKSLFGCLLTQFAYTCHNIDIVIILYICLSSSHGIILNICQYFSRIAFLLVSIFICSNSYDSIFGWIVVAFYSIFIDRMIGIVWALRKLPRNALGYTESTWERPPTCKSASYCHRSARVYSYIFIRNKYA